MTDTPPLLENTDRINLAIGACAIGAGCLCLIVASRSASPFLVVAAAIGFALANTTIFSLTHEATHGSLHSDRAVNEWGGRCLAAFFPTSFSLQRVAHLNHHRNNRSEVERFDYFDSGDNLALKIAQWYGILTGLYWLMIPAFCAVYFLAAELLPLRALLDRDRRFATQTSASAYAVSLGGLSMASFRCEVLLAALVQTSLFLIIGVSWTGWAVCYGAFALSWSSLQYADHAFSALHRTDGAWNLNVPPILRAIHLNYNLHVRHHRDPTLGWRELPRSPHGDERTIDYWRMLLVMWTGPRPTPGAGISTAVLARRDLTVNLVLCAIFAALFALIYGTGDYLYRHAPATFDLTTTFDSALPMLTPFSLVYLSIVPLLWIAPLVLREPGRLLPFGVALGAQLLVAFAIYSAFPVKALDAPYSPAGLFGHMMALEKAINLDGNAFPSLHVALSTSAAWAYAPFLARRWRAGLFVWTAAIVASTMLTRQHGVADVLGGFVLAASVMTMFYPRVQRELAASQEAIFGRGSARSV